MDVSRNLSRAASSFGLVFRLLVGTVKPKPKPITTQPGKMAAA
jgi:hypothetical protein